MLTLTQKTLQTIKKYLLNEQKKARESLRAVESEDPALTSSLAESSEPGTDSWIAENHARAIALGGNLKRMGLDVGKALAKIRKGTYGHCEKCGKHIETGRLLAMPTASLCLSCSKKG